jgi:hypothetical protein
MGNGEHTHIIGISAEVMATIGWGPSPRARPDIYIYKRSPALRASSHLVALFLLVKKKYNDLFTLTEFHFHLRLL